MSWRANLTQQGGTRTQRSTLQQGATRLGITFEEYMLHFDAGERWCSGHKTWEDKSIFPPRTNTATGVDGYCRAVHRERRGARKAAAS